MNINTSIHGVTGVTQQQVNYDSMTVTNLFIKQSNGETFTLSLFNAKKDEMNWTINANAKGGSV